MEEKDKLFLHVKDVTGAWFVLNKKHIVSAAAPMSANPITRIVMSDGSIVDTSLSIGTITGLLSTVEHSSDKEAKP